MSVCIGANTALFNALDQVYARSLPAKRPHDLVSIQYRYCSRDRVREDVEGAFDYQTYEVYRGRSDVFAALAAFGEQSMNLCIGDVPLHVCGLRVSTNYFSTLGIRPALGRLFTPEMEQYPTIYYPVAVISHDLWRRQFGGRTDVIGKQLLIEDQSLTIIGVAPSGFAGTIVGRFVDAFIPLGTAAQIENKKTHELTGLYLLGRLRRDIQRDSGAGGWHVWDLVGAMLGPSDLQRVDPHRLCSR
jgi:putative ABC transport system permease protein